MADIEKVQEQKPTRERIRVESDLAILDTGKWEQMQRIAVAMASASIIPDHLRGMPWWWDKRQHADNPGAVEKTRATMSEEAWNASWRQAHERTVANCFLVVEQALRWGFSPFAVQGETFVLGGKLGYQGKLIAAVVNVRAGLVGRLRPSWHGEGMERYIEIRGRFEGEAEDSVDVIRLRDVKTTNQMWTKDPDQKLWYTGVLHWARRYCPEVVLGITDEDFDSGSTPPAPPQARVASLDAFATPVQQTAPQAEVVPALPPPAVTVDEPQPVEAVPVDANGGDLTADPAPEATTEPSSAPQAGDEALPPPAEGSEGLTPDQVADLRGLMRSGKADEIQVLARLGNQFGSTTRLEDLRGPNARVIETAVIDAIRNRKR